MLFTNFSLVFATSIHVRLHYDGLSSIDSWQYVGAVFLDLSKAFDLVDHHVLLHKLTLYHFTPKNIALLISYLSERTQVVVKGDNLTSTSPQGSIIGPCYSLYT